MDGRFDGVGFLSSPTCSPPPTYPNFQILTNPNPEADSSSSNRTLPKIFDRFYDSSSDDEFYLTGGINAVESGGLGVQSAGKRLDYMIQYLDRKLSSEVDVDTTDDAERLHLHHRGLPEFVASGGGSGRAGEKEKEEEGRPPSLELRPPPLRETQIGCFLRTLAGSVDDDAAQAQLWAGSECGVRFWKMNNIYAPPVDQDQQQQEEAPFCESVHTPATLCLNLDAGNRMVWSGHKDGRIRCWKMDQMVDRFQTTPTNFRECLSWQAHRGPVLSIAITTYGDIWSGSEGGVIMFWPWEAIEKSLSLTPEERHMASLLVERSFIDLRNQVTMEGVFCSIFAADVKFLLSDHSGAKVWSAGYQSFGLWDAHTRELLKVFNIDGQAENFSVLQDPIVEEESRMKSVSGFKKEKVQTSIGFFQRSCNAIMGAADTVIRVAVKGAFGDDNRRTEALTITTDGSIWTGCANGLLVQWDGSGNRLQNLHYHSCAIHCLCTFGLRIWVGYASGTLQLLDLDGNLLGEWIAHSSSVIDIAVGPGYIFTLANNGGIRGWSITSPGPLDSMLRSKLDDKIFLYTRLENLKILTGTWNVGQERATQDSLISWLGSAASDVSIVAVGLQEVEMGAGFLAMSAAKETVGLEGSASGQWWVDMIGKTLDEGSTFQRVGSRQLAGLLIAVWVRNDISSNVGDIDVAAVPCGFGRAIGNKGAVGLRMRVYGRTICFVNCHFAAHQEAVNRRNADFDHVYRTMMFSRPTNNAADAGMLRGVNTYPIHSVDGMPELSEADMVVFLGDFNYRLDDISYDEARDFISQRSFDWLWEKDQLRAEMKSGNVFQGMREAVIRFPPTYKFERHQVGLAGYDSGEKRRIPAWCDRILFRDSRAASASTCNLDCPIVSSVLQYEAIMDVTDSDHKPVRCIFNAEIARVDESIRRQEFGEIIVSNEKIRHLHEELFQVPEAVVSTNNIILQNQDTSILRITNKCGKDDAVFRVMCEGQTTIKDGKHESNYHPRGAFGFPRWLEVKPTVGMIQPGHIAEISIQHEGYETLEEFTDGVPKNCWCEDARDKEVMVVVEVRGSCTTKARSHRVRVRHSISAKSMPMENTNSQPNFGGHNQANVLHRSNVQWLDGSCDVVEHLQNLQHTP